MDLKQFLKAAKRSWWMVALVTLLGLAGGVGITATQKASYASSVKWIVATSASSSAVTVNSLNQIQYSQQLAATYVKVLSTDSVGNLVGKAANVNKTPKSIGDEISASVPLNTSILSATVTDSSAVTARQLSGALATQFGPFAVALAAGDQNAGTIALHVLNGPTDAVKVGPRRSLNYILGLLIGLILGLALAALRELLNSSVRTAEELEALAAKPTLGSIALNGEFKKQPLIVGKQAHSAYAEEFRQLRTSLQFVDVDRPPSIIAVTSSLAGEGKSITAVNLALSFAETGANVLLIEADLRKPKVCDYLGLERTVGLTNVLAGQLPVADVLQRWGESSVSVLAGGAVPPNPAEILGSRQMRDLLTSLRSQFDLIIIDTPPLLPVTDAAVVSTFVDGVVFVVRHGKTTPSQVSSAVKALLAVDARLLGFILNMRPIQRSERKQYGGYHDYEPVAPVLDNAITLDRDQSLLHKSTSEERVHSAGVMHFLRWPRPRRAT